ncbi:hypothetical protein F3087_12385 [Nocardia colli]|uniref:Uncharacterized protein n=1 Tax=Nocardia colli TaxID=2545717 RepID=A0A5N0EKH6_9NOCA|nr:hypothetical protein [Nocardia colli]KAA8887891.1 hypothetical protein F3087_12385 [Nocardia colli]
MNDSVTTPLIGAGLFDMTLDEGHLPVHVDVNRTIHDKLEPQYFSAAAMTGYYAAFWRQESANIAGGNWSAFSAIPTRRAEIITLLDVQSLAEFEVVQRAAWGLAEFTGYGAMTDFGVSSLAVTADLGRITKIEIDQRWAATTQPSYIAYDILDAANQIREQRPRFHESGTWADRSDEDLEAEIREYKNYLTRTS